jgi:metal-responsive CopG/Arc/MetJ family transcriptional regulator
MIRVTFSLDDATIAELRRTAARLRRPQSQVVREAVAEYAARADRMSERERLHALAALEKLRAEPSPRSRRAVDAELRAIRAARREGGRRHSAR